MASQQSTRRKSKKGYNRTLKVVRRIHMYTGLLLLPWVIFFGFSGMLFNHPEWFGPVEVVSSNSAGEVKALTGFEKPDAEAIADSVLKQINDSADLSQGRWVRESGAIIEGGLGYTGASEKGRTMVQISPNHGTANVRYFIDPPAQDQPDFHGKKLTSPVYDSAKLVEAARTLAEDAGLKLKGDLEASTRGGAEVRFQVRSEDDRLWNVSYSLVGNSLSARAADASSGLDFYSVVSRLHKTHHYPDRKGARWVWNAVADATGITMVFWGLSGLIMWWQIKPTRVLGIGGLGIAAVMAALIFTGTFKTLTFGPAQSRGGPSKGAPASEKGRSPKSEQQLEKAGEQPAETEARESDTAIRTGPVEAVVAN